MGSIADANYIDQKYTLIHFVKTLVLIKLVVIMQMCWVDLGQKRLRFTVVLFYRG